MRHQQFTAFCALLRRELYRTMRCWQSIFIAPIVTTWLYFVIFGQVIGARLGHVSGHSFLLFIMPGMVALSMINSCYSGVSGIIYVNKFNNSIEEVLITPVRSSTLILTYIVSSLFRCLILFIITFIVASCFTKVPIAHPIFCFFTIASIAALFAILGFINGIYANSFEGLGVVPSFVLTPLTFLGGAFYSIDQLPPFWHSISLFNPIYYIISNLRYALLNTALPIHEWGFHLGILALIILLGLVANYVFLRSPRLRP